MAMRKGVSTMNAQEISDKAHEMNPLIYENAQVTLESYNQEILHEAVLNVINILSYNAAWDFETQSDTNNEGRTRTVISFKYNGTITAANSLNKIIMPKEVAKNGHMLRFSTN